MTNEEKQVILEPVKNNITDIIGMINTFLDNPSNRFLELRIFISAIKNLDANNIQDFIKKYKIKGKGDENIIKTIVNFLDLEFRKYERQELKYERSSPEVKNMYLKYLSDLESAIDIFKSANKSAQENVKVENVINRMLAFENLYSKDKRTDLVSLLKKSGDYNAVENNALDSAFKYLTKLFGTLPEYDVESHSNKYREYRERSEKILESYNEQIRKNLDMQEVGSELGNVITGAVDAGLKAAEKATNVSLEGAKNILNKKVGI